MGQLRKDTSQSHKVDQKKPDTKKAIPYCMVSITQCSTISQVVETETIAIYWSWEFWERLLGEDNIPAHDLCVLQRCTPL